MNTKSMISNSKKMNFNEKSLKKTNDWGKEKKGSD